MQVLFMILLGALIAFSQLMNFQKTGPTGVPVVYWVADGSQYRQVQYKAFLAWQKKQTGLPPFRLQLDPANNGANKILVQGVTGVAGDVLQMGGSQARYFSEVGLLEDIGPMLAELGITTNNIFPAFRDLITYDGKIVAYPANANATGVYCVNLDALEAVGMGKLPPRWDFDAFEAMGIEYVKRANQKSSRVRNFFAQGFNMSVARNSIGVSMFNETLTAPAFNKPAYAALLTRNRKWLVTDRIFPGKADMDSFTAEGDNYGGSSGLLHKGAFAMMIIGRWHFSTTRFMKGEVQYTAMPHPDGGFQNHQLAGRIMGLYKGSKNKELAKYFFKWLASEDYQRQIVSDADAEPPDQRFLDEPEYRKPTGHTNEWAFTSKLAEFTKTTAVAVEYTPYAIAGTYEPAMHKVYDAFQSSGIGTAESVLDDQEALLKKSISDFLVRHPERQAAYLADLETQKKIDALKQAGKKIPLALVSNPFLKVYYERTGRGE